MSADQFNLDTFVRMNDGSDLEIKIMKAYFELDKQTREALIEHFRKHLDGEEL